MRDEYRVNMRRLISLLRTSIFFFIASAVYIGLRMWAISGHSPARYPDSIGYEHLHFFGTNERLWAVPLLYALVRSDVMRVYLHVVLGTVCWTYLAWSISHKCNLRKTFFVAVLLLGLTPMVIRFDIAILSESLGISFAVATIAATIHLLHSRQIVVKWIWTLCLLFTSFTRPVHLLLIFLLATYYVGAYVISRGRRKKVAAIGFSILSVWGLMQLQGNKAESTLNFYTVLQRRICKDPQAYTWFTKHGMPDIPELCNAKGYAYAYDLKNTVGEILQLPEGQQPLRSMVIGDIAMATWVRDRGWSTYTQFAVSHPSTMWSILTHDGVDAIASTDTSLPANTRSLLPSTITQPWWMWSVVYLVAATFGLFRKNFRTFTARISLAAASVFVIFSVSIWTSAIEMQRHSITSSVMLRVLTLAAVASVFAASRATKVDESVDERA